MFQNKITRMNCDAYEKEECQDGLYIQCVWEPTARLKSFRKYFWTWVPVRIGHTINVQGCGGLKILFHNRCREILYMQCVWETEAKAVELEELSLGITVLGSIVQAMHMETWGQGCRFWRNFMETSVPWHIGHKMHMGTWGRGCRAWRNLMETSVSGRIVHAMHVGAWGRGCRAWINFMETSVPGRIVHAMHVGTWGRGCRAWRNFMETSVPGRIVHAMHVGTWGGGCRAWRTFMETSVPGRIVSAMHVWTWGRGCGALRKYCCNKCAGTYCTHNACVNLRPRL